MNGEGVVVGKKGQELWRPGVKSKLAPGEAVFVALPKARGDGGVGYVDGRVHPNTMVFLGELKENNDREWLKGESPRRCILCWRAQERGTFRKEIEREGFLVLCCNRGRC